MIINEILLKRKWIGHGGVWGILQVNSQNHGQFFFSTLENYEKKIEAGTYRLKYCYSPKFKYDSFLLAGVQGRSGIRIHAGNYPSDLEGCISLGLINKTKGIPNMLHRSRMAVEQFESIAYKNDKLEIWIENKYENEVKIIREIGNHTIAETA